MPILGCCCLPTCQSARKNELAVYSRRLSTVSTINYRYCEILILIVVYAYIYYKGQE